MCTAPVPCAPPSPAAPPPPLPRGATRVAGIVLISDIIRKELAADCSVLMGANVRPPSPCPHAAPYTQRAPASLLAHVAGRARVPAASQPGRRHLPTLWPRTDSCG